MAFSDEIIGWYEEHGRQLPWRGIDDPYRIWLSEIILQQTRIEQGRAYYEHFVETYPTVTDLASASEEQVLRSWQGLGYYSRARNLHAAARQIVERGGFPDSYEGILSLKGVGRYTAAAIASFAFKLPYPVIDGNVYRLVSRCFGIDTPIGTSSAYNEFERLLLQLIDRERPDVFNQAMMDFGSLQCRPLSVKNSLDVRPEGCTTCVLAQRCVALQQGRVAMLPVKAVATPVRERYFYYLDIRWEEGDSQWMWLHKRSGDDIWKGLYEVPLIELEAPLADPEVGLRMRQQAESFSGSRVATLECCPPMVHKLTHRTIIATYVRVLLSVPPRRMPSDMRPHAVADLQKLPLSRLMERLLS